MSRLEGGAEAVTLFDALPESARQEAGRMLADIAQLVLTIQQRQAPVRSGDLKAGLTIQDLLSQLKERIGLFNLRKGKNAPYYAPWVYYGRNAGTTKRIVRGGRQAWDKLIQQGKSSRRARPSDLEKTVRVGAIPANPFLNISASDQSSIDARIADYWSRTLANVGAGS